MKKFIVTISILLLSAVLSYGSSFSESGALLDIPLAPDPTEIPHKDPGKGPRMPSQVPVKAVLNGNCLKVWCIYESSGEVSVVNESRNESLVCIDGDLYSGIEIFINEIEYGFMSVKITLNGKAYVGYF